MKNKTLIYDDACPACSWYTGAFVKTGLLEAEERKAFSTATPELLHTIDWQRSKNEIPLLDIQTKKVLYGIDALLEILGSRFACIKTIGTLRPVNWFLKKLYNFISYNRKVIVARKTAPGTIDCTPRFNILYRLLFMAVFLVFNSAMLLPVHNAILSENTFHHLSFAELQATHLGLVGINCLLATSVTRQEAIEYLGQVNMLALVTILLLVPLMLANTLWQYSDWLNYIYLAGLTFFVIKEYFRRMDYAGIAGRYKSIVAINLLSLLAFITCLFIL